jgi:thiol-disulfide isomerase/thioredoxin
MAAEIDTLRQQAGLLALREPTPIMDFELDDLQGRGVKLSSFKGKVFLLNFWATWCEPCRTEIPTMIRLHDKLSRLGFEIVAIDVMESPDTVARYVREARMTFPVLLDNDGKAANTYGARGIPTTYVVDHTGNAVSGVTGAIEWHTPAMEEYLRALLAART